MSKDSTPFTRQDRNTQRSRKTRDAAVVLPILGVVLLCTPLVSAFAFESQVDKIPDAVLYVFGVWFILIGCTAILSRRLNHKDFG